MVEPTLTYYHGSRQRLAIGLQLVPPSQGYTHQPDVAAFEALVESRRPPHLTPRTACVFLCTDPDLIDAAGGYTDFVYRVMPVTTPEVSDLAWYTEASLRWSESPVDMADVHRAIDAYWSGDLFHAPRHSLQEHRVCAAHILELVEENP